MIISRIVGGLGNQMFQYAAGRSLSIKHAVPYLLDINEFSYSNSHQGFELERIFTIPAAIAKDEEIRNITGWQSYRFAQKFLTLRHANVLRKNSLIIEAKFNYSSSILNSPSNCYLIGYWQSEKYFSSIKETIRADFVFRSPMSDSNKRIAEVIGATNSVSMHVRRGDYISNNKTFSVHGVCSVEYYERAIRYIADHVNNPVFFIFSDDFDWIRENLKVNYPYYYVDNNRGSASYNDMHLMSLCSHNIIANSTFSWWGAWLNLNNKKIVIAPKKWFAKKIDISDLILSEWILL
jgi:hypothetical protein